MSFYKNSEPWLELRVNFMYKAPWAVVSVYLYLIFRFFGRIRLMVFLLGINIPDIAAILNAADDISYCLEGSAH